MYLICYLSVFWQVAGLYFTLMETSLLSLAMGARNSLMLCGPTIFKEGDQLCIANYTSGMASLQTLMNRLQAWVGTVAAG